jgi:hypothetical protein
MKSWLVYSLLPLLAAVVFVESSAPVADRRRAGHDCERPNHHHPHPRTRKGPRYDFEDDLQLFGIEQVKRLFQNRWNGKLYRLM